MNLAASREAQEVLDQLASRGVNVRVTPEGNLRYKPKDKVDESLLARLKACKAGMVELISPGTEEPGATGATSATPPRNADTYGVSRGGTFGGTFNDGGATPNKLPPRARRALENASELGLVARWSYKFGYVAIHDPSTGEWCDLSTKAAPGWAKREALRRTELYREKGIRRLLTAREMQELWDKEHPIADEHPATDPATDPKPVSEGGLVYLDYLEGEG